MIQTVLGPIAPGALGKTLMHEHIIWDWKGAEEGRRMLYTTDDVARAILPHLLALRQSGCRTLVEATTAGAGRDLEVLRECARQSGLNIVTNAGAWDGGKYRGQLVPRTVREADADEVAAMWAGEFRDGIEGTGVKPGFIKLAMGDEGTLSALHEKLLRAGARAGRKAGLAIQCHVCPPPAAARVLEILEEERFPLSRYIWVHADAAQSMGPVLETVRRGAWVELDCLIRFPNLNWHIDAIRTLAQEGLTGRVLLSQDAGCYYVGANPGEEDFHPYDRLFNEFVPEFVRSGIPEGVMNEILTINPARVLDVE